VKVYRTAEEESTLGYFNDQQKIQHVTDLPIVKEADGSVVTPSNLLLFDNEGKMVFKNEKNPSKLYVYDLETGKLEQTIKTGKEEVFFNSISNDTRGGQKNPGGTLYGVETQGLHQIDPRIGDNSLVNSRLYKTNYLFNTIAATPSSGFAVGSANGDIRMYK
jgi:VID27 C-terminal WD40-like domain